MQHCPHLPDEVCGLQIDHKLAVSKEDHTLALACARLAEGRIMTGVRVVHHTAPSGSTVNDLVLNWSASEAEEGESTRKSFSPLIDDQHD